MRKILFPILCFVLLFGCKNDTKKDVEQPNDTLMEDNTTPKRFNDRDLDKRVTFDLKRLELVGKEDQKAQLEELLISKSINKETDAYIIDFEYPYLNETINPLFKNFNDYIQSNYLDTKAIEKQILEEKRLCDSLGIPKQTEKRIIEFKIYNLDDKLLSVLFYRENHYTGAAHASYTFDGLNFNMEDGSFMGYNDIFEEGSEEDVREALNVELREKINSGEMYYDCWEVSADDFQSFKNTFVIHDNSVEFYFDDCVICPSYTGTYSIDIPLEKLTPLLQNSDLNSL